MKRILLVFLIIGFSISLFAQNDFNYGIQIGYSRSSQAWDLGNYGNEKLDPVHFITGSVFANYFNFSFFNINSTFGFRKKGGVQEVIFTDETGNDSEKKGLNYITNNLIFSTGLRINYPIGEYKLHLTVSPELNYVLSTDMDSFFDNKPKNKILYGYMINFGSDINFLANQICIDFFVDNDITEVFDRDAELKQYVYGGSPKAFNSTFGFQIGIIIK